MSSNTTGVRGLAIVTLTAALVFLASCDNRVKMGVVTIEVSLDKEGGTQPVAGEEFRLLNGNMIDLLGGNSKDPNGATKLWDLSILATRDDSDPERRMRASQPFQTNSLSFTKTDSQGKGKFLPVLLGTYYIVGWARSGNDQLVIWNYEIQVKEGEQNFGLNSSNAATIAPLPRQR